MSKEEFIPKKRAVLKTKIYETQRQWEKKKTRIPHEQLESRNESKNKCRRSFRHFISPPQGFLIEAVAQESTIAGLVNADQTNPEKPKAPRRLPGACIAEESDPWGTCFVPHHTAYQPCRGTAYSASGQSWADEDVKKVTVRDEGLGTELCSCHSCAEAPEESVATFDLIGSYSQAFLVTWSPWNLEVLA